MKITSILAMVCLLAAAVPSPASEREWVDTSAGRAVRVSPVPRPATRVNPRYPESLRTERIEGLAVLQVVVDEKGEVVAVEVVEATRPEFADAATTAVRQWRFRPHLIDGKPAKALYLVPFAFRLS